MSTNGESPENNIFELPVSSEEVAEFREDVFIPAVAFINNMSPLALKEHDQPVFSRGVFEDQVGAAEEVRLYLENRTDVAGQRYQMASMLIAKRLDFETMRQVFMMARRDGLSIYPPPIAYEEEYARDADAHWAWATVSYDLTDFYGTAGLWDRDIEIRDGDGVPLWNLRNVPYDTGSAFERVGKEGPSSAETGVINMCRANFSTSDIAYMRGALSMLGVPAEIIE